MVRAVLDPCCDVSPCMGYLCTKEWGHDGPHVHHGPRGGRIHSWK